MVETRRVVKDSRSDKEVAIASDILKRSAKTAADDKAFAKARQYHDATLQSKHYNRQVTADGLPVRYFRQPGESIVGVLGECAGTSGFGQSLYPVVLDDRTVIYIPGNRRLVKAIKRAKATFLRVKITFTGKYHKGAGHFEKVYLVEHAPFDQEPMTPAGRKALDQAAAEAKSRKSGKGK